MGVYFDNKSYGMSLHFCFENDGQTSDRHLLLRLPFFVNYFLVKVENCNIRKKLKDTEAIFFF